jgi:hypothetical protein
MLMTVMPCQRTHTLRHSSVHGHYYPSTENEVEDPFPTVHHMPLHWDGAPLGATMPGNMQGHIWGRG